MEMIQGNQTGTAIQLNLFEAIKDLLLVKPIFLIGVFLIGFFLFWIFNKGNSIKKDYTVYIPFIIILVTFVLGFFS